MRAMGIWLGVSPAEFGRGATLVGGPSSASLLTAARTPGVTGRGISAGCLGAGVVGRSGVSSCGSGSRRLAVFSAVVDGLFRRPFFGHCAVEPVPVFRQSMRVVHQRR